MTAGGFEGRACAVTGAGSGIGQSVVRKLLEQGARVMGADVKVDGIPAGAERLRVDVTVEADVENLVRSTVARFGRLDLMVNNAGVASTTSVVDCTQEDWDRTFAVNARGVFFGCRHAVVRFLEQGEGGVIINTASVAGMVGLPDRAAYCASKAAVIALTKQVAIQYARDRIRCNCVCPGTIDSPWVGRLLEAASDAASARKALVARQPIGRLGTADEVATAILYLASDEAGYATGTSLVLDGGILAG